MTVVDMFFNWGEGILDAFQNIYDYLTGPMPVVDKVFNDGPSGVVAEWLAKIFYDDYFIEQIKSFSFADFFFSRNGIIFFTTVLLLSMFKRMFF